MIIRDEKHEGICPVARMAELLGNECTLLIIRDLLDGTKRFGDLERSLSPISSRTITRKLKVLEMHGLIEREAFREKPPRTEYSLTKHGRKLRGMIEDMRSFGRIFLA
jgi:DNA-binding HxlR family transcriptional regulator